MKNILTAPFIQEISEMTANMYRLGWDERNGGNISVLLDEGEVKEYNIEIKRIYLNNNYDNKCMILKVNDTELIEKTGGIIQGMSGSPIIQNGMLVGAVTHVFVNEPERGYAVFAETMLEESENFANIKQQLAS